MYIGTGVQKNMLCGYEFAMTEARDESATPTAKPYPSSRNGHHANAEARSYDETILATDKCIQKITGLQPLRCESEEVVYEDDELAG